MYDKKITIFLDIESIKQNCLHLSDDFRMNEFIIIPNTDYNNTLYQYRFNLMEHNTVHNQSFYSVCNYKI